MSQLSLLPAFDEAEILYASYRLLEALNDGRKKNERYHPECWYQEGDKYIFMAAKNRTDPPVFNILDSQGNIPEGYSANWRSIEHIKHDLKS